MTGPEKSAALARLERLLRARDGVPGYSANVKQIKMEIDALKAQPVGE